MLPLEPLGIELDEGAHRLYIAWSDGHTSEHNVEHLRWLCPCAECRGEWGQPGRLDFAPTMNAAQTRLDDVRPVGRYALQPVWGDGHSTGLYTYDYLRANCECAEHLPPGAAPPALAGRGGPAT